jgi:hypothetical protein
LKDILSDVIPKNNAKARRKPVWLRECASFAPSGTVISVAGTISRNPSQLT